MKVNKIDPPTVELLDPEGNSLGILNEYEFLDARAQICEHQLKGYSFKCEEGTFRIDQNGRLEYYPKCFDLLSDAYLRLI
ncbi:MAG: hypothetical protein KDH96_03565 [Candidatus Riesia sp.]|nr:hypothetical protein [Candidatus Riesia sp.]